MSMAGKKRLRVGVIGLGRLGRIYARDIASRIPETRLVAVSDVLPSAVSEVADEFDVPGRYADAAELVNAADVEAVVIVSPTHAHKEQSILSVRAGKPTFCEKPPALSLASTLEMKTAITLQESSSRWASCGALIPATRRRASV